MHEFRKILRAETAAQHHALDARLSRLDLADRAAYGRFLLMHAAVLPGLEAEVARACAGIAGLDMAARVRAPSLSADLAALDLAPPAPLPLPTLADAAEGLGALYVLEGSRLGARLLIARARESRDPAMPGALRYLAHGADGTLWRRFLDAAAPHLETARARAGAVSGAKIAFDAFHRAARLFFPPLEHDERAIG